MPLFQASMEFVATLACAIFAGAALYINLVEHPARMVCGTELAIRQWAPSYKRATWMQAPLAIVGFLCRPCLARRVKPMVAIRWNVARSGRSIHLRDNSANK